MTVERLTQDERRVLLKLARQSIEKAVVGEELTLPSLDEFSAPLREDGACFVTLTLPGGELRGCIGGLEACMPLVLDVCKHAIAAAQDDYRFEPVRIAELPLIAIEISRLTPPEPLVYDQPMDLPGLLHPHVDGVVVSDSIRRATFLPQVWDKIPDPFEFLTQLCRKMGAPGDVWRRNKMMVEIYHVEEFSEAHY